jgi:hypothetical protein
MQAIARGIKALPAPQLEIAVITFRRLHLLTYIFSFPKPQNVTLPMLYAPNQTL